MKKPHFPAALITVLIAVLEIDVACAQVEKAESRPNLVFLLTDDQSTYSLGCYGNEDVKTPNIDGLAADGIAFDHHYDTTAICMASRASILTGKFEYKTGCNFEHGHLVESLWKESYPLLLREAGYRTAIAGKIGLEITESPGGKGHLPADDFDAWGAGPGQTQYATARNKSIAHYAEEFPHSSRAYGAFGRDFILESAKDHADQPFCLSISFKAPHMPDTPDAAFDDVYAGKTFRKPANYGRDKGNHFSLQSRQGRQFERFFSWGYADNYDKVMARYHQLIYGVDVAVGMIRKALEEAGVAENTVIIFTSDNGFFCGSHGYGSKVLPYEESSRVPLIVYDPRHENSGKELRCRALTGNVDFAPTLLELAGLPVPEAMDGKSLLPLLDDPENAATHESLPLINVWGPTSVFSFGVVTRDWKYVYWPWAEDEFQATDELYHLEDDRLELINYVADTSKKEILEEIRRTYDKALSHWESEAVDFHNYQPFATYFDREATWEEKKDALAAGRKPKGKGKAQKPAKQ